MRKILLKKHQETNEEASKLRYTGASSDSSSFDSRKKRALVVLP